jgi:hypothetical protein
MIKQDVHAQLTREPFAPLRIHLTDGRAFDVPFKDVAHLLGYGVLVLIGLKEGTHQAKAYDRFFFEQIDRIEPLPPRARRRPRRRAS